MRNDFNIEINPLYDEYNFTHDDIWYMLENYLNSYNSNYTPAIPIDKIHIDEVKYMYTINYGYIGTIFYRHIDNYEELLVYLLFDVSCREIMKIRKRDNNIKMLLDE